MGLIIVGSVALDDVKTSFGVKERVLGGAASFASVSASFFHKDVYLVGVVGGDFPKEHIEFFRSRNIDLKGLEVIENGNIEIEIIDLFGRSVDVLYRGMQDEGFYNLTWYGKSKENMRLPQGWYIVRMKTENYIQQVRISLIR